MSLILDGTNGLTFNNATTQASGSKVLQVVNATISTTTSTTSSTAVTSGLTATITPLFSTSKIMVVSCYSLYSSVSTTKAVSFLYRNGSNISASNGGAYAYTGATGGIQVTTAINLIDSPATTSATTYAIYVSSSANAGSISFNPDTQNAYIILMEVAP